jgi:hypothetical protein
MCTDRSTAVQTPAAQLHSAAATLTVTVHLLILFYFKIGPNEASNFISTCFGTMYVNLKKKCISVLYNIFSG